MIRRSVWVFCSAAAFVGAVISCGVVSRVGLPGGVNMAKTAVETANKASECEKLRDLQVSYDEEVALGGAVAVNVVGSHGGLIVGEKGTPEYELTRYMNMVGKNLAAQSTRPTLDWTFGVLKSDEFNAFAAPGGYVFVTTGLLKQVDSEAQLAGVLGHEIGHITGRHALTVYSSVKANQCQTALAADAGGSLASQATGFNGALSSPIGYVNLNDVANLDILAGLVDKMVESITTQGYAHSDEYAADQTSASLVLGAGYDPDEFTKFLDKIPEGGGGIFSTHPKKQDRQGKINEWKEGAAEEDPFAGDPESKDLKSVPIKGQLKPLK
jgi:beta-barrel assembly-enhancing protease